MEMEVQTANAETNTNPLNYIGLINTEKKKKPHNITIKNFNPNEPKIRKSQILYSDKQKYRKYKTNIEPKLNNKIMVDEEEDLIAKIRKEFGIEDKTKKNYSSPETSGAPHYDEPNPIEAPPPEKIRYVRFQPKQQNLSDDLTDMTLNDYQDIIGGIIDTAYDTAYKEDEDEDEDDDQEQSIFDDDGFEVDDDDEPAALTREASRGTELSTATTAAAAPEDLEDKALRYGIIFKGPKPKTDKGIEKREKLLRKIIAEKDKERGAAS